MNGRNRRKEKKKKRFICNANNSRERTQEKGGGSDKKAKSTEEEEAPPLEVATSYRSRLFSLYLLLLCARAKYANDAPMLQSGRPTSVPLLIRAGTRRRRPLLRIPLT